MLERLMLVKLNRTLRNLICTLTVSNKSCVFSLLRSFPQIPQTCENCSSKNETLSVYNEDSSKEDETP
jgi:hypothetical protein